MYSYIALVIDHEIDWRIKKKNGCITQTMPLVIGSIIWDIGFPFITSAFCLIQLAFLQLTQVSINVPNKKHTYIMKVSYTQARFIYSSVVETTKQ